MTFYLAAALVALAAAAALAVYGIGLHRLREALHRLAGGETAVPLMLGLPRGLRTAGSDLKRLAARVGDLERSASAERLGLSAVMGSFPEGVFVVDAGLSIREANAGAAALFGPGVSPVGRTVLEASRSHEVHRAVEEGVRSGRAHRAEIASSPGKTCELSVAPLTLGDGAPGAIVVVHDISRIRGLERLQRDFVANVSHELRTPLTIINGYLEALAEGGLEDPGMAREAVEAMARHSDRLKRLVDDLLVISRVDSQKIPLEREPVDLAALVRQVVGQYRELGAGARIEMVGAERDFAIEADPGALEQVLFNLVDNALKHGKRDGLRVSVTLAREGGRAAITVADNGPGIPYADQAHVFERFYRVHKHRSRETGGTGLGLSIVQKITEEHGGTVSLESVPGEGTSFKVSLPIGPESSAPAKSTATLPAGRG